LTKVVAAINIPPLGNVTQSILNPWSQPLLRIPNIRSQQFLNPSSYYSS
jgi:hypothetical protein